MSLDLEFLVSFDKKRVNRDRYESLEDFLVRPVPVRMGQTVGREIESGVTHSDGRRGVRLKLPEDARTADMLGGNLSFSKDNPGDIVSGINGYLHAREGLLAVSDILEVYGDVDFGVGDISTESAVRIHGGVTGGRKVRSKGDVEVLGLVEEAEIRAGGNVHLKGGMAGADNSLVLAGKDLYASFVQHGRLEAEGDIVVEGPIMGCDVSASGKIVQKGRGALVGGAARAMEEISANNAGSEGAMPTEIILGYDPFESRRKAAEFKRLNDLREELDTKEKEAAFAAASLGKLAPPALDETLPTIFWMADTARAPEFENLRDETREKFNQLGATLLSVVWIRGELERVEDGGPEEGHGKAFHNASLKVSGIAHPAVRISILEKSITLTKEYERSRFSLKEGKITVSPL
ncbi:MAG: FapA family protein [Candidatus Nitrospinota bacterium M3_3B_026]